MTELILKIIFISAFCNGLYLITDEGMILNPLLKLMEKFLIDKRGVEVKYHFLYKPLIGCLTCFSSVWGSLVYWVVTPFTIENLYLWPIVIICVAYGNNLLNKFI